MAVALSIPIVTQAQVAIQRYEPSLVDPELAEAAAAPVKQAEHETFPVALVPVTWPTPARRVQNDDVADSALKATADEVRAATTAWARAWSAQDVERYLAFYAPQFKPPDGQTREAWEKLRRARVSGPRGIQVSIGDIDVRQRDNDRAAATFCQDYRSESYKDSVRKMLELVRDAGRWLIAEERIVSTLSQTSAARTPAAVAAAEEKAAPAPELAPAPATHAPVDRLASADAFLQAATDFGSAQSTNLENSDGASPAARSGIPVGSMIAFPGVDIAIGYDDNLLARPRNPVSSPVIIVAPYLVLEGRSGPHLFDFRYNGKTAYYSDSPDDNFNNNAFQANARLKFGVRNDVALRFDLKYGVDPRGSTDRQITDSPDRYREIGVAGLYGYGARGAKGRIEVDADYISRRYTNNPQAADESDLDTAAVGAAFYWRVMPKTRLLFQGRYRDFSYVNPASTLNSDEQLLYVGAQWDATAKTSGYAKYGRTWKNFASSSQEDESSNSWDVGIRWSPRTYSVFDLSALQRFRESTGVGDSILERRGGIGWTHAWNSRLSHNLSYARIQDTYLGAGTDREDDTDAIGVKLSYQFRPWARFGAEYTRTERDSNDPQYPYTRNVLLFTLGLSL